VVRSRRASRCLRSAVVLLGVGVAAVAASGLWLSFRYEPASDRTTEGLVLRAGGGWVKDLHVAAGWVSVIAAGAIVVGLILQGARRRASWVPAGAMSVVLASTLVAVSSGRRLPWLQVAVRAITVGSRHRGVWWIGSHDQLFVLTSAGRLEPGRYRMWLVLHVVIVPICSAVAVLAVVASRRASDRRAADAVLVEARPQSAVEIVLEREHVADDAP
jgi:hypothetical protein